MPVVSGIITPHQSQGGFFKSNSSAYKESALSAVTQTGVGELKSEIQRRLPGYTYNDYGFVAPGTPTTGSGGTAFVADTIDPTLGPGDMTPLTGNTDTRLKALGTTYLNSVDTIIAANNATTDKWLVYQFFQTHDVNDSKGAKIYNQALGNFLWWNFVRQKLIATGKPFRMFIVAPGYTDRPTTWNMGFLHEVQNHISQNGLRCPDPLLAGFDRIQDLYLLCGANGCVSFDDAREADGVATASDRAHQSVGSSLRLARQMALGMSRWIDSSVSQEYDGIPYVVNAFWDEANTRIRVRIKITANNRLVWVARVAADASGLQLELGPSTAPAGAGHIMVQAHRIYQNLNSGSYQPARPEQIPASAISVDNTDAATGYAYLDIEIGSVVPTLGSCFSIQPANFYAKYGDQLGVGAASTKPLYGLREEAGGTPYTISGACEDVLIAGRTFLPVMPVSNVPVAASDPGV